MQHQEDIYSVLNEVIMPNRRELYTDCFTKKDCERLSEEEQKIFILLKNLASLGVKYTDGEAVFSPAIEIYGKGRSFGLQDMTEDDYIVLVDSQKKNSNVTDLIGDEVACIDHHPIFFPYNYLYQDIRPVGSCSCLVASYFQSTDTPISPKCAAALAYGIKMDTADFTRGTTALDTEMLSFLFGHADWDLVSGMYYNTMEFNDLQAYGAAIQNIQIFDRTGFAYIPFNCAPALIAIISDFILSLDVVDIAIIYALQTEGIRFSVRSEQKRIHAGNLIARVLKPYGDGGGHPSMAGGMIPAGNLPLLGEDIHTTIQEAFLAVISE